MTTALLYHHLKTVLEFKIVDDQMTVTLLRRELCLAREDTPFLEALGRSDSHVLIDQKKFRVRWRNDPLPEPGTIPSSCRHTIGTRTHSSQRSSIGLLHLMQSGRLEACKCETS